MGIKIEFRKFGTELTRSYPAVFLWLHILNSDS